MNDIIQFDFGPLEIYADIRIGCGNTTIDSAKAERHILLRVVKADSEEGVEFDEYLKPLWREIPR